MSTLPDSQFFSEGGRAIAERLYIDQMWGRNGLAIERLCNELAELRARVEALEREVAMNELRAASAEARPTVEARITRDRDETGDYLIIHDASPPASSLVERVDRAAIREVAVAARGQEGQPLTWEHVAQWLEQEADRG